MDSAYDSSKIYEYLEAKGIEPIIKPRRNSRLDTKSKARRRAVELYKKLGHKAWIDLKQYGRRWMDETAFSMFKRLFGEHCLAKTPYTIAKELIAKAFIYNMIINL